MEQIFISSVQHELAVERRALRDFVHNNDLLRQFFSVFLFEDLPPADRSPDDLYLEQVKKSTLFVGIYGNKYGNVDAKGLSAIEKEFNIAAEQRKRRLILIKGREDNERDSGIRVLLQRFGDELVRRRFDDINEMLRLLYGSLIQYLQDRGFIVAKDFDAAPCINATLDDISDTNVKQFIERAKAERNYAIPANTPKVNALTHLNLLTSGTPTNGAVLLFCDNPERYINSAEVSCCHFHGTEISKPIPNQQVYRGSLFTVIDKSVDFVMSALTRTVIPSASIPASSVTYDVPYGVIREAVVNAIAHRNYASKSGVQIMVFSDRIELWNPGGLPEDLTADLLQVPHPSVPRNRLICEPLFLAHYIERAGSGTLDMIRICRESSLPDPEFQSEGERFVVVIWRNWLTDRIIAELDLNDRQIQALQVIRKEQRITNSIYQKVTGASRPTSKRDLEELVMKRVLQPVGSGRGAYYVLSVLWHKNGS